VKLLLPQLDIFKILMKDHDNQIINFQDIPYIVKNLSSGQKHLISEVLTACRLLLVNPATSATGERMFSMARRVKTWLRAYMQQQRFRLSCTATKTGQLTGYGYLM
jgi:hypothetical protein